MEQIKQLYLSPNLIQKPYKQLIYLFKQNKMPHSIIFTGEKNSGKALNAIMLAMYCNCQNKNDNLLPCLKCSSCKKIFYKNHPDIFTMKPDGNFIKISQIRSLIETVLMKPYESSVRVIIIENGEIMNLEASNAFLKLLEEPPQNTVFVLTTCEKRNLLKTINSRCQHFEFNKINIALNNKTQALDNKVTWLIQALEILDKSRFGIIPAMLIAENLVKDNKDNKDKEKLLEELEILKEIFRDLIVSKFDLKKIINLNFSKIFCAAEKKFSIDSLLSSINDINKAQKAISLNANTKLTIEALMISILKNFNR